MLAWGWFVAGLADRGWTALLRPFAHATAVWGLTAFHWMIFVAAQPRLADDYDPAAEAVLFNLTALSGLLTAATLAAMGYLHRRFAPRLLASPAPPDESAPAGPADGGAAS